MNREKKKKLYIIGSGIKSIAHLTNETIGCIKNSNKVLYLLNEPLVEKWVQQNASESESVSVDYFSEPERVKAYSKIANKIIEAIDKDKIVSFLIYGHPCFYAMPGLMAASKLESNQDISVEIIPALSSLDCLYADLAIDPGQGGIYIVDASELIAFEKMLCTSSHLVIEQIGMVGNLGRPTDKVNKRALEALHAYLLSFYPKNHKCILYEAALYPRMTPKIIYFELSNLLNQQYTTISTLYIPPKQVESKKVVVYPKYFILNN